jgi:hypothetical protein
MGSRQEEESMNSLKTIDNQTDDIKTAAKKMERTSQRIAAETVYLQGIQLICDGIMKKSNFNIRIAKAIGKCFDAFGEVK